MKNLIYLENAEEVVEYMLKNKKLKLVYQTESKTFLLGDKSDNIEISADISLEEITRVLASRLSLVFDWFGFLYKGC